MGTLIVAVSLLAAATGTSAQAASLQSVGTFSEPTFVTSDPGNPNRLFVVQRKGKIMQGENGTVTEFANLEPLVSSPIAGEQGLLSIALAPDFASSGRIFAFYTGREAPWPEIHIGELRANGSSASFVRDLLTIPHPNQGNHYGGQIAFGPEGLLFIATGDGGGSNDEMHNAQDKTTLLGKILRIGVDPSGVLPYTVPTSNPFAGSANANERLVFAYGLRNPYRFSFDRLYHDLVIGDVGQSAREEIDWAPVAANLGIGRNYGWNCREGRLAGPATDPGCSPTGSYIEPAFDYPHIDPGGGAAHGSAVIGGYVVRDPSLPELAGRYLYGDLNGEIRSLVLSEAFTSDRSENLIPVTNLNSFGEDSCGRIYAVSGNGPVYRLTGSTPNTCMPTPPPVVKPLTPSVVGIRAVTRRVKRNGRAQLTVWVSPCNGRRGQTVKLFRNRARLGSRRLDRACTARFLPRVDHRVQFRAEIAADATYEAATSRRLGVRVYRPKKGELTKKPKGRLHIPPGVGHR